MISSWQKQKNGIEILRYLPTCVQNWIVNGIVNTGMSNYPQDHKTAVAQYFRLHISVRSDTDRLLMMHFKAGVYYNTLIGMDLHCPIGVCFGSRDFLGSEGADRLVRENKFFATGESQLFKINDSDHNTYNDNPEMLSRVMIGFFNGKVKHKFEPKPRAERS